MHTAISLVALLLIATSLVCLAFAHDEVFGLRRIGRIALLYGGSVLSVLAAIGIASRNILR